MNSWLVRRDVRCSQLIAKDGRLVSRLCRELKSESQGEGDGSSTMKRPFIWAPAEPRPWSGKSHASTERSDQPMRMAEGSLH